MGRHRVVVGGGGFGGLQAVLKLRRAPVEVTLVDRRNFHLFQPLTYQVATGALSAGEITYPLRGIFKRDRNVRVVLADVGDFDSTRVSCTCAPSRRCRWRGDSVTTRWSSPAVPTTRTSAMTNGGRTPQGSSRSKAHWPSAVASSPPSKPPKPSRARTHAMRGSRSSSSAPGRPELRWPGLYVAPIELDDRNISLN